MSVLLRSDPEAGRRQGLRVESPWGDVTLPASQLVGTAQELGAGTGQVNLRNERAQEAGLLAPDAQMSGDGTDFAFAAANPDGIEHVLTLGRNVFGFEDLRGAGDRDFNDPVISLAVQPQPIG